MGIPLGIPWARSIFMFHEERTHFGKGKIMHPIRMMGRLSVRGQSYAVPGSGHGDTVPFESLVAGALGMGRLHRGAELVGLVIYARHHDVARELVTRLAASGSALFERKGWKVEYCYGIAEMLVFELLWTKRCPACTGNGCDQCDHRGRLRLSVREQGRVAGISHSRYVETWADRAHEMRLQLVDWENVCLRHLIRHFEEMPAA